MKAFAEMITALGTSTKTNEKLELLSTYFATANDADKVWVIALFSGRRPRRIVNSALLKLWCREVTGLPEWLFEEAYHTVGDLAESIALMLPEPEEESQDNHSLSWFISKLIDIEKKEEEQKREFVTSSWRQMNKDERFVFNKLLTGNFRIGVSQKMIVNALAKTVELEPGIIAHRISGNWDPAIISFDELMNKEGITTDHSKPYPFYLAYALNGDVHDLGNEEDWQAEWKWDGIRGQLIRRNDELFTWSRGEELMTAKFPEYHSLTERLPNGIVLDGEIIPSIDGRPLPFALLQTRIGRKNITKKNLQEVPVSFFAYDILEYEGNDVRQKSLSERRELLEMIVKQMDHPALLLSGLIPFSSWDELTQIRTQSRDNGAEGLMLKRKSSTYQVGRKVGDWWKWKIDPLVIDAVMIYAQKGHGRRSNLYTDYTFAVRDGDKLVSFAKAYSGLTDKEFAQVDHFVKNNSLEKFGPVRTVKPELVFEIAFEGIAASKRHKSGVALRFPRISRWRRDKKAEEINTLDDLKNMLEVFGK
ncbi:MAG TPA: ATP-dependent DNA ligase [Chitinophagaceae bacterium]|jgi:DNA ligase-1|nr:ATP-dependent DNA ligase [Chitinophagaceae bacterium]